MSRDKDYYKEGRRDAEHKDGWSPPHEGIFNGLLSGDKEHQERKDYREGYRDGKKK